jgi:type IV pilus assembly protein PilO
VADLTMGRLPWWAQLLVFAVIGVAGAGAFYYFYEMPAREQMTAREAELTVVRGRIDKGLATARQLPEFRAQVADLEGRLAGLRAILPEQKDVADLLRRIQTIAAQSDLQIRGFKPQPIATKELHAEWPISLELEGNYHNLGLFLDRVSKFPRIINVGAINMTTRQDAKPNATVEVTCTATTFVMIETPPPAAAAPGKKGAAAPAPSKKTE